MIEKKVSETQWAEALATTKLKSRYALELRRELNLFNRDVVKKFKKDISSGNYLTTLTAQEIMRLENIVIPNYFKISSGFAGFDVTEFVAAENTFPIADIATPVDEAKKRIYLNIASLVDSEGQQHLESITNSIGSEKVFSLDRAREVLAEQDNGVFVNATLATVSSKILSARLESKLSATVITETTLISEGTRSAGVAEVKPFLRDSLFQTANYITNDQKDDAIAEAGIVSDLSQLTHSRVAKDVADEAVKAAAVMSLAFADEIKTKVDKIDNSTKTWFDMRDKRVRPSHAKLNGVTVPSEEPFISSEGFSAMYPGDGSLGASTSFTIACRCFVSYN
jgi:hypothetical protein